MKPPTLKHARQGTSAFSLKSVHKKKKTITKLKEENFDDHPRNAFDQSMLERSWQDYQEKLQKKGEHNIAAILSANKPLLKADFNIVFTLPNQLMEEQLNQGKPQLMKYLRESLNNYGISIETIVNETMEKRFAYTPLEKYKRLKEKNPMIEKLKDVFQLNI